MTRLLLHAAVILGASAATFGGREESRAPGSQQPGQPVFRARTELVRVDVLVTDDGVPLTGLTATDFDVYDNGVRQQVTTAGGIEALQIGVVLDFSDSMTGGRLDIARAATTELLGALSPDDRFAVVAFGDRVARLARAGTSVADAAAAIGRAGPSGATALLDGTYAGILEASVAPGPTLLLVMTDGRNNASSLPAAQVLDAARFHEAAIYPVAVGVDRRWTGTTLRRTSDTVSLLEVMAERTGGRLIEADWNTRLGSVFQQILREYRQRYILTFSPEGVGTGDGWHAVEVKVRRRGAIVRARSRYWAGGSDNGR